MSRSIGQSSSLALDHAADVRQELERAANKIPAPKPQI